MVDGVRFRVNTNALVEPERQFVDDAFLQDALESTVTMLGEEIGRIEKVIRSDLTTRQDDAIKALNERIDAVEATLSDLQDQVNNIAGDLADIERSGNVTKLRGHNAAA